MNQEQLARVNCIVDQLDEHLQLPQEANRRKLERVRARFPVQVMILSGAAPVPLEVYTRNLSLSGIGLMSRRLFQSEERIALLLKIPGRPAKLVFARVTFARYLRGGLYEVGAEFLERSSGSAREGEIPAQWIREAARQRHASQSRASEPPPGEEKKKHAKKDEKPPAKSAESPPADDPAKTAEAPEPGPVPGPPEDAPPAPAAAA